MIRNSSRLGRSRSINMACELAGSDDVVLLGSDTVVGPHWLRNLKIAAYRTDRTGTVTPVSNNAGAYSVPRPGLNEAPEGLDVEALARIVSDCRIRTPFEVPIGGGFCLYVKRALIDDIGMFDVRASPLGGMGEDEFCMRALMVGWCHRVDPATYVGKSGSQPSDEPKVSVEACVEGACPELAGAKRALALSRDFELARYRIARKLDWATRSGCKPKPRIMYVISTRVGGTPQTNADLMRAVAGDYDCYALWCNRHCVEVMQVGRSDYRTLERYPLSEPVRFATHVSSEYDDIVRRILVDWGIDLLHIRHVAWHSLNLVDVAKSLDIPVVHSFHDFYSICPSVTLVGEDGSYHSTGVTEGARNPLWRNDPTDTGMNEAWLAHWKQRMQGMLGGCDAYITTSTSAKEILANALPLLVQRSSDFHIIPHGRDFERFTQMADLSDIGQGEPLRILLPGNIGLQKGLELVKQAKELDTSGKFEFHLLGKAGPGLASHVVDHGPYEREEFAERVAAIRPHIAAVLSIWPETWCHTLTECWSCGVPVLGIELGAVGERIGRHEGGWLLQPPASAQALIEALVAIRESTPERVLKAGNVRRWQITHGRSDSTAAMAGQYVDIYRGLMLNGPR
ncbi:glycosyltransferase [Marilutibacter alkalisoli]|uniref:glycosyltransferase n=1 Tax=Marilutibacter alkalisoli TaxID=2591633 RepID=UPI0031344BE2